MAFLTASRPLVSTVGEKSSCQPVMVIKSPGTATIDTQPFKRKPDVRCGQYKKSQISVGSQKMRKPDFGGPKALSFYFYSIVSPLRKQYDTPLDCCPLYSSRLSNSIHWLSLILLLAVQAVDDDACV